MTQVSPALEIRGLEAGYARTAVLRGVDLVVERGVTAVLGPSGCGKTTMLRAVAGFVRPAAGTITVAGTEVVGSGRAVAARRRGIGYVPQEGALFPHLTVARNVAFGLPRGERRSSQARVAEALELVELAPELAERYPHELSGGQQQRVALARALAPRPRLVLLDEPFSSLDASLREDTGRAVVRALEAAGAAAVLVTHDQGEALSLADQVAVMAQGRFLQVDSPTRIYLEPADPAVAAFLGHATLLPGRRVGSGVSCALGTLSVRGAAGSRGAGGSGGSGGADEVQVAVRSEQVQVVPDDGSDAIARQVSEGPGGVAGEVADVSFFGHDATVRVVLATGELIAARTPADAVLRAGDRVRVGVVGDVVAFAR
ncbi:ABC transporter ATP-binding protein [Nocardioides sp.]|uniref:ABC transporter ATP-binding protein n=1 Tax=Nocardioides sp. TaxID=35761 RepID=UPI0035113CDF